MNGDTIEYTARTIISLLDIFHLSFIQDKTLMYVVYTRAAMTRALSNAAVLSLKKTSQLSNPLNYKRERNGHVNRGQWTLQKSLYNPCGVTCARAGNRIVEKARLAQDYLSLSVSLSIERHFSLLLVWTILFQSRVHYRQTTDRCYTVD